MSTRDLIILGALGVGAYVLLTRRAAAAPVVPAAAAPSSPSVPAAPSSPGKPPSSSDWWDRVDWAAVANTTAAVAGSIWSNR